MRKSTAVLSPLVALLAVALVTSIVWQGRSPTAAAPTPTPTSSEWPAHTLATKGYTTMTYPVPRGAHSVTITLACTDGGRPGNGNEIAGSGIGIDVVGQHGRFNGCDDGEHSYAYPVKYSKAGVTVEVSSDDSTRFTLAARFSSAAAGPDPGTVIQCKGVSKTLSAVYVAETDYAHHRITRNQWSAQIRDASAVALGILPENTMLDHEIAAMQDALGDASVRPGELYDGLIGKLHPTLPDWAAAVNLSQQVCDYNGSGVQILDGNS